MEREGIFERWTASRWFGLGVVLFGASVLAGYAWRIRPLVQWHSGPGNAVAMNTAIGFVLAGWILLWPAAVGMASRWPRVAPPLLALILAGLNALVLAEIVFHADLGVDLPQFHRWIGDVNPHPGRMAPDTCVGFLLFAAAVLMLPYVHTWRGARPIRILTMLLVLIGSAGLLSALIGLEVPYSFAGVNRMPAPAGGALIALGWGFWFSWREERWNRSAVRAASGRPILSAAAAVLVVVVVVAGMSGFFVVQTMVMNNAINNLGLRREERAYYIKVLITQADRDGLRYAQSPEPVAALQDANSGRPVPAATLPPATIETSAVVLISARGTIAATIGTPVTNPTITLPLPLTIAAGASGSNSQPSRARSELLWSDGFVLRQRIPVRAHDRPLGTVLVEQSLPLLGAIGVNTAAWGQSGEMGLCGLPSPASRVLECFPQRLRPHPFVLTRRFFGASGPDRPMALAIEGRTGVVESLDYRNQRVLAAYAPIPELGLGFVVKMDLAEIFAPLRHEFEFMLPLLAALAIGGIEILRWQLRPLIDDLVESRNQAVYNEARFRAAAESSLDGFYIFEAVRDSDAIPRQPGDAPSRAGVRSAPSRRRLGDPRKRCRPAKPAGKRPAASRAIRDFRLRYANPPGERLAGLDSHAALDQKLSAIPSLTPSPALIEAFRNVVRDRAPYLDELEVSTPGEPSRWLHYQVVPLGDGVAATVRDITERKQREERLLRLAQHDALTGLPNRRAFLDRLAHAMESARRLRFQGLLGLLYLDIDGFKQVNDQWGHSRGDRLLQQFGDRLRHAVRAADTVARMGGDEFTILLENLQSRDDAERVVATIFLGLNTGFDLDGQVYFATTSVGVAFFRGEEISPEDLLARADQALYQAKRGGRNRFAVFAGPAGPVWPA